jgi:uncharacterized cupin superfamily protein
MSMTQAIAQAPTPPIFDLKEWAASVRETSQSWRFRRMALPLDDHAVSVEAFRLEAGSGEVASQSADEFLHVLDGALSLHSGDVALTLSAGQSAVVPAGAAFEWRCDAPVTIVAMRRPGSATPAAPCLMDVSGSLSPSAPPSSEVLLTPTPDCRNLTLFKSADQTFSCGVWDSTPYTRTAITYGHYELMHLIEGEVTFVDDSGFIAAFQAGDLFLVRKGARCSWRSLVDVTKVFAIYRPA